MVADNAYNVNIRGDTTGEIESGWNLTKGVTGYEANNVGGFIDFDYDGWKPTGKNPAQDEMFVTLNLPKDWFDGNGNGWTLTEAMQGDDYFPTFDENLTERLGSASDIGAFTTLSETGSPLRVGTAIPEPSVGIAIATELQEVVVSISRLVPSRTYRLQVSTNLAEANPWSDLQILTGIASYEHREPLPDGAVFYRLVW